MVSSIQFSIVQVNTPTPSLHSLLNPFRPVADIVWAEKEHKVTHTTENNKNLSHKSGKRTFLPQICVP